MGSEKAKKIGILIIDHGDIPPEMARQSEKRKEHLHHFSDLVKGFPSSADANPHRKASERLSQSIREEGAFRNVESAYMDFAHPTVEEAFKKAVEGGAKRVLFVGGLEFLSEASHPLVDLPKQVEKIAQKYPHIEVKYAPPAFKPFAERITDMLVRKVETESKKTHTT
jgi:sirohydrochlorin ferrochelatase